MEKNDLLGVDTELGLYELTDLFYAFYKYHNEQCLINYEAPAYNPVQNTVDQYNRTLSRFQVLRRIEACRLGSRPYIAGEGIGAHKPNVSFGYLSWFLKYLVLPYKSLLTDSEIVRVTFDKRLYNQNKLGEQELEEMELAEASDANIQNSKEIGDDVSDAFSTVLKMSKGFQKCMDVTPLRLRQDGVMAYVHSDVDYAPTPVIALDLVTEPQAEWDSSNWSSFFVIRKMTAQEAIKHMRERTPFWNADAIRWSLENSIDSKGLLGSNHYNPYGDEASKMCGENYMVKSFYQEYSSRESNIGSYYGNMLVVEGYYVNAKGKVNKVIFFPSADYTGVSKPERTRRESFEFAQSATPEELKKYKGAGVMFFRENVFDSMEEAITVIPAIREETSIERQRAEGHELFGPIEMIMKLDSSILNFAILMGVPFTKNLSQAANAQNLEDLEVSVNSDMVDLGDREFVQAPFNADLNAMLGVRTVLLQHCAAKAFLGGLDGNEMSSSGRGAQLANLRLVRDGRVHKHAVEDFAQGLRELLVKMLRTIIDLKDKQLTEDILLLKTRFFDYLTKVQGHDEKMFEYNKKDIVPDTGLPYWIDLQTIRNGAAHFGAAEMVLYSEIKQVFGDGLDQQALQALNRMGIKSILGNQDAIDILGDPKNKAPVDAEQMYRASMENAAILGSVDSGVVNYEPVNILTDKDDHVLHISQVHLPKMTEILKMLQEGDVTPEDYGTLTEDQLDTKVRLSLKLGALANHVSQHADMLNRFGRKREDINRLKEETNYALQSAEAILNNIQIALRALAAKREEKEMKLQGMSPENEAEKMKIELELAKLQAQKEKDATELAIANKLADNKQQQSINEAVSKAKDRYQKQVMFEREMALKAQEQMNKSVGATSKQ